MAANGACGTESCRTWDKFGNCAECNVQQLANGTHVKLYKELKTCVKDCTAGAFSKPVRGDICKSVCPAGNSLPVLGTGASSVFSYSTATTLASCVTCPTNCEQCSAAN